MEIHEESREGIMAAIQSNLPLVANSQDDLREESPFAELGVTSLCVITVILELQRTYSLPNEFVTRCGFPATVGDLVSMVHAYTTQK